LSYEGNFGEQPVGQVMSVSSWGLYLQATQSGKIVICHVDPASVSALSGIKAGAILKALTRRTLVDERSCEKIGFALVVVRAPRPPVTEVYGVHWRTGRPRHIFSQLQTSAPPAFSTAGMPTLQGLKGVA
jgi:hypothetical protein